MQFEKVVQGLWEEKFWPILVQSTFTGKAREVYAGLSQVDAADYELIKKSVLEAYELCTEAYRQAFRGSRLDRLSHVEYASLKTKQFNKWVSSAKISQSYEGLKDVVLEEEFRSHLSEEVRDYLADKTGTLRELAEQADAFLLNRKMAQKPTSRFKGTKTGTEERKNQDSDKEKSDSKKQKRPWDNYPVCKSCGLSIWETLVPLL